MHTTILSIARLGTVIGREVFSVASVICGIMAVGIALVIAALVGYAGYHTAFPHYSAETSVPSTDVKLRLDCFLTADGTNAGLYLVATTSRGGAVSATLWTTECVHLARTSIYRVDDSSIAVLGPTESDYRLSLTPLRFARERSGSLSDNWQYLGVFDFDEIKKGARRLRFFEAREQPECIPMAMDQVDWSGLARAAARHPTCPGPRPAG